MIFGIQQNNRIKAKPGVKKVFCPFCQSELVAACGKINIWHFRHKSKMKCNDLYKPLTEWHFNWQQNWPENNQEVIIKKDGKTRIADILTNNNMVIEFQNSFISPREIWEREKFYGNMIWVFNLQKQSNNFQFDYDRETQYTDHGNEILYMNNKYPKKHIYTCKKPVFIDLGVFGLYYLNAYFKVLPEFRDVLTEQNDSGQYISETTLNYYPVIKIPKRKFIERFV